MQKFERPKFKISEYVESDNYGKFVISPLERGFGTTLGNALRRVMLSSLPGGAVYSIKLDGVYHEFSSIKGVRDQSNYRSSTTTAICPQRRSPRTSAFRASPSCGSAATIISGD